MEAVIRGAVVVAGPGAGPKRGAVSPPAEPRRVLVVDDDAYGQRLLCDALTAAGYYAACVRHGVAATTAVAALRPDVLVVDMSAPAQLPLLAAYRRAAGPRAHMVLATGLPTASRSYQQWGCSGVLEKPFRVADLRAALAERPAA